MADLTDTIIPEGGGDYPSVQAWITARLISDSDLVGDDNTLKGIQTGGNDANSFTMGGFTTDATHFPTLEIPISDRHDGTRSSGARNVANVAFGAVANINDNHFVGNGLEISNTSTSDVQTSGIRISTVDTGIRNILNCLVYDCGGHNYFVSDTSAQNNFINCQSIGAGQGSSGGEGFRTIAPDLYYNCDSVDSNSGSAANGDGFRYAQFGTVILKNCFGGSNAGSDYNAGSGTFTTTTCYDTDGTADTTITYSTSTGTYFTNVTSGSEDLKIASASSGLIDNGTDLSADGGFAFDYDFQGTSRPSSNWDVGAYEFISGGTIYDMSGTGQAGVAGAADLFSLSGMAGVGQAGVEGIADIASLISLISTCEVGVEGIAVITSLVNLLSTGQVGVEGTASIVNLIDLISTGQIGVEGTADLFSIIGLAGSGEIAVEGIADLIFVTSIIEMSATGQIGVEGIADLFSISGLAGTGEAGIAGTGRIIGVFGISANGEVGIEGQANLSTSRISIAFPLKGVILITSNLTGTIRNTGKLTGTIQ